jgi:hypothetical protein
MFYGYTACLFSFLFLLFFVLSLVLFVWGVQGGLPFCLFVLSALRNDCASSAESERLGYLFFFGF